MAEYICREAIIDDLEKEIEAGNVALDEDVWINKGLRIAIRDIKDIKSADVQHVKQMKINVWLYDDKGHCKGSRYFFADSIEILLKILASIEKEGYSSYTIGNGSNSRSRKPKHSEQIVLRCDSCGAAIRVGDKYNKLHVKGQKYCFCGYCIGLSEYTAKRGDI